MRWQLLHRDVIGHLVGGWPQFDGWPRWDSMSHQTVQEDWLRRAVDGGLRLMVMLAVNSEHVAKNAKRRAGRGPETGKRSTTSFRKPATWRPTSTKRLAAPAAAGTGS